MEISNKTFDELIRQRRSHRKFQDKAIEADKINQLLKCGLMAPAGKSANPWEFIVVTDADTQKQLSKCKPNGSAFVATAPLSIVVIADTTKSDVWVEDCSIAAIYLQLKAEDMGLCSCWVQVRNRKSCDENESSDAYIRQLLSIPENYAVECVISIGDKVEERKPFDESKLQLDKIHQNKF